MKRLLPILIFGLCCGFIAGQSIRWQWNAQDIFTLRQGETSVQFGLRNDGVVVWREVTQATNSPAEQPQVFTNQVLTNSLFTTNILITP